MGDVVRDEDIVAVWSDSRPDRRYIASDDERIGYDM
jgi:hypothetical protein